MGASYHPYGPDEPANCSMTSHEWQNLFLSLRDYRMFAPAQTAPESISRMMATNQLFQVDPFL